MSFRVAVVTPYFKPNPNWLAQCHDSVNRQTHVCTHIMVSDGAGPPPLKSFSGQLIELSHNHADFGDTPRAIGAASAVAQEFDAIAFLDADNWYLPDHIETLVALQRSTGAAVCTSSRVLHDLEGVLLGACPESNGQDFADTNCLFFARTGFRLVSAWVLIPEALHDIDDRWMWGQIRLNDLRTAHSDKPTVAYRSTWPYHYQLYSRLPPAGIKTWEFSQVLLRKNQRLQQQLAEQMSRAGRHKIQTG